MQWINSTDLKQWAEGRQKRDVGLVLEKLVLASSDVQFGRFLHGENNEGRGWDGSLSAQSASQFVPDGRSIWEWGVDVDYFSKAESDFQARTFGRPKKANSSKSAQPDLSAVTAEDQKELTFVFVTPYLWNKTGTNGLDQWIIDKRKAGSWKDVRIIDGQQLERWLALEPAVAKSLAREMGLIPDTDVFSIDEYWELFSSRYKWPLAEEVILAGRDGQRASLLQALSAGSGGVVVSADSQEEAVAFAAATIRKSDQPLREQLLARTVIVESKAAGLKLPNGPNRIVVAKLGARDVADFLALKWPTVIPAGRTQRSRETTIKLPLPSRTQFSDALEKMGLNGLEAEKVARRANRSVTILARQEYRSQPPEAAWAHFSREELIPPFLAGGWNNGNENDRRIVCALAGVDVKNYHKLEEVVRRHSVMEDAPWDVQGDLILVRAPVDAFLQTGHLLTAVDLDRLERAAVEVFSEIDPQLDVSPDDLTSRSFGHSSDLRDGLAQTLLVIAVLHDQIGLNVPNRAPGKYVDDLISKLPGLYSNERLIASLDDQFPLLMEAAPGPLLEALEQQLKGNSRFAATVFQEYGFLGTGSFHTGILWGLERLAWDPQHLKKVANTLFLLASADPGGKLSNRPINTLAEIFLPWHPGTMAPAAFRNNVLGQLVGAYPTQGWKLLLQLLPESSGISTMTAQPQYRDYSTARPPGREVRESYQEIAKLALQFSRTDASRWKELIPNLPKLPPDVRGEAYDALRGDVTGLSAELRNQLWEELHTLVVRHRRFAQANWALPEGDLRLLEEIVDELKPLEPSARWGWLFNEHFPDVEGSIELSSQQLHDLIEEQRKAAVQGVMQAGGDDAVVLFATKVTLPYFVGRAYEAVAKPESVSDLLTRIVRKPQEEAVANFVVGVSNALFLREGSVWTDRIVRISDTNPDSGMLAAILLGLPSEPDTWDFVRKFGSDIDAEYWKHTFPARSNDVGVSIAGAKNLLVAGRPLEAIASVYHDAPSLPTDLIVELLNKAIDAINAQAELGNRVSSYRVEQLFEALRESDIDPVKLGALEFRYLSLLGEDNVVGLHRLIASDPTFLTQLISSVYRSSLEEDTDERPVKGSSEERLASASFKVLMAIGKVAVHFNAEDHYRELAMWVAQSRELAAKTGHADITDIYIGKVLAHTADNEQWPPDGVAQIIESQDSEKILSGVHTELFNKRGTYGRGLYDGGEQERAIASTFDARAAATSRFPSTSAMLTSLATSYRRDALAEDERVEQRRLRDR